MNENWRKQRRFHRSNINPQRHHFSQTQIGKARDIFQYVPFAMESILHINATSSAITERGGIL